MKIKLSVVMPAYNAQDTIESSVQSVFAQSDFKAHIVEVIVVNDGSKDSTAEILDKLSKIHPRLKVYTINNSGPSAARNYGIKKAKGNWIGLLDSDDEWDKHKTECQVHYIEKYPAIKLIGTTSDKVSSRQGRQIEKHLRRFNLFSYFVVSRLATPSLLIKKSVIEQVGYFDESMKYAEDQNLLMKIITKHDAYVVTTPLVKLADKPLFGAAGLSANLKSMHEGVVYNLSQAHSLRYISVPSYGFLRLVEQVKYSRRLLLAALRKSSR